MIYRLKDVLEDKGYIRGPFGSALKRSEMLNDGIPVYEQQNAIYENRDFRYYINEEKYEKLKRFTVKENDLIVSCSGTVGKVSIIRKNDEIGIISQALLILRPNIKIVLPEFLYYFFKSNKGYNSIVSRSSGSVQVNIAKRQVIEEIEIEIPTLEEQRGLIQVLSDLDEKIETNNKINKKLEEMAQAIFKQWFVDFEFPNEDGKPYKSSGGEMVESELGMIPKGWRQSTLEEVAIMSAGGDKPKCFSKNATEDYDVPIYSNGIDNEGLYGYTDKAKIFEEAITVSARGTIGYVCLRQQPYFPIVRLISLVPHKSIITSKYLYFYLKLINISGTGTTQQQLTVPDFKRTKICIPKYQVIKQFTDMVNDIFRKIEVGKNENMKLAELRDTLLPKLMSGEIRVSID